MMQNLKVKNVKCAPKINGGHLDFIRFFAHDKSICHEIQLYAAVALSGMTLKIKDYAIHNFSQCFNLKELSYYFKKFQNVIFNSLTRECTGEGIVENFTEATEEGVDKEGSTDINIEINELPLSYTYQSGFNELKKVNRRYLG